MASPGLRLSKYLSCDFRVRGPVGLTGDILVSIEMDHFFLSNNHKIKHSQYYVSWCRNLVMDLVAGKRDCHFLYMNMFVAYLMYTSLFWKVDVFPLSGLIYSVNIKYHQWEVSWEKLPVRIMKEATRKQNWNPVCRTGIQQPLELPKGWEDPLFL